MSGRLYDGGGCFSAMVVGDNQSWSVFSAMEKLEENHMEDEK